MSKIIKKTNKIIKPGKYVGVPTKLKKKKIKIGKDYQLA